jgi:para-nitrobenzyl esterase
VILQSGPFGAAALPAAKAERVTATFLEQLGMPDATLEQLRGVPVPKLLEAQRATVMRSLEFGSLNPPLRPVIDGVTLTEDPLREMARNLNEFDLLLGFTAEESRAFFFNPALWGMSIWEHSEDELLEEARRRGNPNLAERLPHYTALDPGRSAGAAFCDLVSDDSMIRPTVELAIERSNTDRPAYLYELTWAPDGADERLRSCHGQDLPLLFGAFGAWQQAPILGNGPGSSGRKLAEGIQDAWLTFAASGEPGGAGLAGWRPCAGSNLEAMRLDAECGMSSDIARGRRWLWLSEGQA